MLTSIAYPAKVDGGIFQLIRIRRLAWLDGSICESRLHHLKI